ncbi:MAG: hypothetical protein E7656_10895 [Ruminococcaceae bacterium]|nr:hypothetical protein [Oscillospiraceae bacterium]
MKTIKKLSTLTAKILCLALALCLALSGCAKPEKQSDLQQDAIPPKNSDIEEPGQYQLVDTITAVLDNINEYRPGTLGSSLKICIVAFSFIDFSQEDAASDTQTFADVASGYIAALDDEHLQYFKDNVGRIEEIAAQLFNDGLESLLPRLDDAGNPQKHEQYDKEKYDSLMGVLKGVLENF